MPLTPRKRSSRRSGASCWPRWLHGGLAAAAIVLAASTQAHAAWRADEIVGLIPDARLATIAAAGHHAAGDNPKSTVSLVTGFLAEIAW